MHVSWTSLDALNDFEEEEQRQEQHHSSRDHIGIESMIRTTTTTATAATITSSSSSLPSAAATAATPPTIDSSSKSDAEFDKIWEAVQQLNIGVGSDTAQISAEDLEDDIDMDKIIEGMSEEEKEMFNKFTLQMQGFFEQMQETPATGSSSSSSPPSSSAASTATLDDTIKQTLDMLAQGSKEFDPNSDLENEDAVKNLLKMFGDMSGGSGSGSSSSGDAASDEQSEEQVYGFLENIMKALMSPEVLEEPMKHLKEKYPVWLEKNKGRVPDDEYERVQRQFEYSKRIVSVYESQRFPDSLPTLIDLMKDVSSKL